MSGFRRTWPQIDHVEGWLTEAQAEVLYDAARSCPPRGRIVEIGSYRGRSTIVLALAAPPSAEVVAIDPHAGSDRGPREIVGFEEVAVADRERFAANLAAAGVAGRVRHLATFSGAALDDVPGRVDILYVDGAHRYRAARSDLRDWGERVAPGGEMLVHDAFSSIGVTAAVLRELLWSRRFRYEGRTGSLARYRFDPSASRRGSALRQLAQLPWFAKNLVLKAMIAARVLRRDWPY